jgi:hypothetical protein
MKVYNIQNGRTICIAIVVSQFVFKRKEKGGDFNAQDSSNNIFWGKVTLVQKWL